MSKREEKYDWVDWLLNFIVCALALAVILGTLALHRWAVDLQRRMGQLEQQVKR